MRIEWKEFVSDFETTVDDDPTEQEETEIWAAASIALDDPCDPENVAIVGSIDDFMQEGLTRLKRTKNNILDNFHNLKFDGSFIMTWLLNHRKFKEYAWQDPTGEARLEKGMKDMPNWTFTYLISSQGQWYQILIKAYNRWWKIIDSLKLLPFSVRKIGKDFKTKYQKSTMEYQGKRYANCPRTEDEDDYIRKDVLVMHEAINYMRSQGQNRLTMAGCAMADFRFTYTDETWDHFFPDLYQRPIGEETEGEWIRSAYHGGWCYLAPKKAEKIWEGGTTCDVNSLYPSVMLSASGNRYPIGLPTWWYGNRIPTEAMENKRYFFIRVKTRFKLKKGKLPCIQIKGDPMYNPREWLERSDIRVGSGWASSYTIQGRTHEARPTLTLTMTDWALIKEQYNLYDTEILEGCYFETVAGLFDDYITKWAEVKKREKGAKRALAKLMLNSLYGRFAMSEDSSYQMLHINEDGALRSEVVEEYDKRPGYIPIGAAITSYARDFTIRAAQKNYKNFIYADTDSIHCHCGPDEIMGCPEHESDFLHWKYEAQWDQGWFVRQKTYAEHVTGENRKPVTPYWNVKCAGMPEKTQSLFRHVIDGDLNEDAEKWTKLSEDEKKSTIDGFSEEWTKLSEDEKTYYIENTGKVTIEDFRVGLQVPGALKARRIKGGTVLIPSDFKLRPRLIKIFGEKG